MEGVDLLEVGNYDIFYHSRYFLSKQHILHLAKEVCRIFPSLDVCVTIPCILSLQEQLDLACQLEHIGVQALQTEGLKIKTDHSIISLTELINLSVPVLSTTYAISEAVSIPVIASSGMNIITATLATCYGASAVGMGYSIKSCKDKFTRYEYIKEVIDSIVVKNNKLGCNSIKMLKPYNNTII